MHNAFTYPLHYNEQRHKFKRLLNLLLQSFRYPYYCKAFRFPNFLSTAPGLSFQKNMYPFIFIVHRLKCHNIVFSLSTDLYTAKMNNDDNNKLKRSFAADIFRICQQCCSAMLHLNNVGGKTSQFQPVIIIIAVVSSFFSVWDISYHKLHPPKHCQFCSAGKFLTALKKAR